MDFDDGKTVVSPECVIVYLLTKATHHQLFRNFSYAENSLPQVYSINEHFESLPILETFPLNK